MNKSISNPKPEPPREDALFQAAVQLSGDERASFLNGACHGDPVLRGRLEALLAAHEQPDTLLAAEPETAGLHSEASARQARVTIKLELTDTPDDAVGQAIGRYKLLEKIGEGGCGVVYVAEQAEPVRRRVALKVIKLGMDTKAVVARFEAERQALAMMDHPNIAKVLDAGSTETGRPYFVMELVRGIRITDYCDQNKLSAKERLDLFIKVCQAIQHAHQKGIIHRDIKPSNTLVTLHDGVPVPKVIDFGIAKATEGRLTDATVYTQLHQFIGTPAYMSPEQAEMSGLDIDTRSDIYSLGVLLYELLAGSTPFDAKELMAAGIDAMRKTIREQEPVRPSTRLATLKGEELTSTAKRRSCDAPKLIHLLRGDLDWIIMKCLEKDRVRRYETANGLAADLLRHLHNEPVLARPPSSAYRFQKMVRRNKLVFAAGTAVSLAVVAGLGFSSWSFLRERKAHAGELTQHRIADEQRQRAEARETEARRLLYVADMNLAQNAWEQNHIGRLRELLADTQSSPDRGFEWYYWQQQSHQALKTLRGHMARVSSVAFSPDGRRIVTGSYDHTAKVWEASSGRELFTLKGHGYWIDCVAFSPGGELIVTGSNDRTAKVWEANSGREQLTLKGHASAITSVAFSFDGRQLVTGSGDHTAKVWEVSSGRELLTLTGHRDTITCVAFSPDGQRIVTGDYGGMAKVWDASSARELLTFQGHTSGITSVAFSPDGQRIVTGSYDQTAKVWEPTSGRELLTLKGHSDMVLSVAFSPNGQWILTGSNDKMAKLWDASSGRELLTLKGHLRAIWSAAFSSDGLRIVTGSDDGTAKVWEPGATRGLLSLKGHTKAITSVDVSADGQRILTGSDDGTAKVWDASSGRELLTLAGHDAWISAVAFSKDGQSIVTGSKDATARVWDAASGRKMLTLNKGHTNWLAHPMGILSVAFSPDGARIVTGSEDSVAKVWDAATGNERLSLRGHKVGYMIGIMSVAFSPDGRRIVTGSADKTAKVWDADSGQELLTLAGHTNSITSVAFSPDGRRIITGSSDNTAKLWAAADGRELLTLEGHDDQVLSVAFSPEGQRIITASMDGTARLWELVSGRELLTLQEKGVRAVAFSPDGQRIVTGGWADMGTVWEAARPNQVAQWQAEEAAAIQH